MNLLPLLQITLVLWYNMCMIMFNLLFVAIALISYILDINSYITVGAMLLVVVFNLINLISIIRGISIKKSLRKEYSKASIESILKV